ncbi:MAG: ABC transporter permease [Haloferacaceae archaeon]
MADETGPGLSDARRRIDRVPVVHDRVVRCLNRYKTRPYAGYLLAGPYLAYWFALFLLPLVFTLIVSGYENVAGGTVTATLTLANYATVFASDAYLRVLLVTVGVATVATLVAVAGAYPLAYFVAFSPRRRTGPLVAALVAALLAGSVVRALGWFVLLGPGAPQSVGAEVLDGRLLHTSWGVTVAVASVVLPVTVLVLARSLRRVDAALVEAAYALGGSPLQSFVYVTVPLSVPGVVSATVVTFVLSMGAFAVAVFVGPAVPMLAPAVYASTAETNWPLAAALAVVLGGVSLALAAVRGYAVAELSVDGGDGP